MHFILKVFILFTTLFFIDSYNINAQVDFSPKADFNKLEPDWCKHMEGYYISFGSRNYELEADMPVSYNHSIVIKGFKSFFNVKRKTGTSILKASEIFDFYTKQFLPHFDSLLFKGPTLYCVRLCIDNQKTYINIQYADKGDSYYITIIQEEKNSEPTDAAKLYRELIETGKTSLYFSSAKFDTIIYEKDIWILDAIVEMMDMHPEMQLNIESHTDNEGDRKDLIYLSYNKARYFYETLVALGIDAKKVSYSGYGPDFPIATNTDCAGRFKNNRITLSLR